MSASIAIVTQGSAVHLMHSDTITDCLAGIHVTTNPDPYSTIVDRECSRLISCAADHSGDWLDVLPTSMKLQSDKFTVRPSSAA